MPRNRHRLKRALLVAGISLLAGLCAAELALRTFRPVAYRAPQVARQPDPWRSLVHRRSEIEGLAYELNPGSSADLGPMHVQINALGLRGPEVEAAKPPGVKRVAAVGDSITFGFGVNAEQAWPAVLERLLDESGAAAGERWQVLNFGVGGYSSRDEAIVVRERVLPLDPDVIVLGWCVNDPQTAPLQPLHQRFHEPELWERSHLLRLLAKAREDWGVRRYGHGDEVRYWSSPDGPCWETVPRAFDDIRDTVAARGIPVLVVTFPYFSNCTAWRDYPYHDIHQRVLDAARERGFDGLDSVPALDATGKTPQELRTNPWDELHPNAEGHAAVARAIHDRLRATVAPAPQR